MLENYQDAVSFNNSSKPPLLSKSVYSIRRYQLWIKFVAVFSEIFAETCSEGLWKSSETFSNWFLNNSSGTYCKQWKKSFQTVFWKYFWRSFREFTLKLGQNLEESISSTFLKGVLKEFQKSFNKTVQNRIQKYFWKFSRTFGHSCPNWQRKVFWNVSEHFCYLPKYPVMKKTVQKRFKTRSERNSELSHILVQIDNETNSETFR
jgi:hypothetical protein